MIDWAERECRIACKKENPNFNFDSDDFDYGCSCYKSALKAYKSLCEDEHSGASWGFTKNILIRLMESQPLTPITDEDFFSVKRGTAVIPLESDEYLKERGLKSNLQCPRMSSLFREETLDGKVSYHDVDRAYYINVEEPSDTYSSWCGFIDEMFPITMPYVPKRGKYKIYAQTFLTDKKHGDFDTKGILYVITPDGERVDLNIYRTEGDDGNWKDITKEEYEELLSRRIDKLNIKVADHLLWTLISNSSNDDEIAVREKAYRNVSETKKQEIHESLRKLCLFFENPDNYQYNTFHIHQALCNGNEEAYKDIPELVEIGRFLQKTLANIMNI
jgi:hypothetical protein